jgi:hypothetical protein
MLTCETCEGPAYTDANNNRRCKRCVFLCNLCNCEQVIKHRPVVEIEAELAAAKKAEYARLEKEQKAVQPQYVFTLDRVWHNMNHLMDNNCTLYRLNGKVTNKEELKSVGKIPFEGGMTYVYNNLSGRFVIAIGGGSIFTSKSEVFRLLNKFIDQNPNGGDVTHLMNDR